MSQIESRLGGVVAVVPAAGIGSRMGAAMAKQYLALGQQTILAHTLDALLAHPSIEKIVVALHPQDDHFQDLSQSRAPKVVTVIGGGERADSVLAALQWITQHYPQDNNIWALVHDAARPCVRRVDIDNLLDSRLTFPQGAILAAPVHDTMKRANSDGTINTTESREALWHALTPQLFKADELASNLAAALAAKVAVTDEASAMEWAGIAPGLVSGHSDNIKVTHPDDLALAGLLLNAQGR